MKKEAMIEDDWDFGFTAVHEADLESVQTAEAEKTKSEKLYKSILPLLGKLKENSEKDYIFWPNRLPKVEEFEQRLKKIYES